VKEIILYSHNHVVTL